MMAFKEGLKVRYSRDNLPLCPNQEWHISGHSKRGKDACSFTWWAMETMQQVKGGVGYHYADFSATL
ncbi:hypothetical protein TIFTF001_054822 [Ficus carica]|uniref:Uncharacterized protein n=1 Tax=Ficus carica TaxID=3494 RepID=A0AA88EE99_FICCA|nr:hypothetical protein TIFTF001_054822 [Ficus carica]